MAARTPPEGPFIAWLESVLATDTALVGGKAASLGELAHALAGMAAVIPQGFAVTTAAYRALLADGGVGGVVEAIFASLATREISAAEASSRLRDLMGGCEFSPSLAVPSVTPTGSSRNASRR